MRLSYIMTFIFQVPDYCRDQSLFILTFDDIINNNVALAVFIGKLKYCIYSKYHNIVSSDHTYSKSLEYPFYNQEHSGI